MKVVYSRNTVTVDSVMFNIYRFVDKGKVYVYDYDEQVVRGYKDWKEVISEMGEDEKLVTYDLNIEFARILSDFGDDSVIVIDFDEHKWLLSRLTLYIDGHMLEISDVFTLNPVMINSPSSIIRRIHENFLIGKQFFEKHVIKCPECMEINTYSRTLAKNVLDQFCDGGNSGGNFFFPVKKVIAVRKKLSEVGIGEDVIEEINRNVPIINDALERVTYERLALIDVHGFGNRILEKIDAPEELLRIAGMKRGFKEHDSLNYFAGKFVPIYAINRPIKYAINTIKFPKLYDEPGKDDEIVLGILPESMSLRSASVFKEGRVYPKLKAEYDRVYGELQREYMQLIEDYGVDVLFVFGDGYLVGGSERRINELIRHVPELKFEIPYIDIASIDRVFHAFRWVGRLKKNTGCVYDYRSRFFVQTEKYGVFEMVPDYSTPCPHGILRKWSVMRAF